MGSEEASADFCGGWGGGSGGPCERSRVATLHQLHCCMQFHATAAPELGGTLSCRARPQWCWRRDCWARSRCAPTRHHHHVICGSVARPNRCTKTICDTRLSPALASCCPLLCIERFSSAQLPTNPVHPAVCSLQEPQVASQLRFAAGESVVSIATKDRMKPIQVCAHTSGPWRGG